MQMPAEQHCLLFLKAVQGITASKKSFHAVTAGLQSTIQAIAENKGAEG